MSYRIMSHRIAPAEPPYAPGIEATLTHLMPPRTEPLILFRTLARNERLFQRFMAGNLLDPGTLTLREREIAIDRTCARCGAEYEWGVHIALFAAAAGFGETEIKATVHGTPDAACWSQRERLIVQLMDELHDENTLNNELWTGLKAEFSDEQILELIMLAGLYHMVAFMVNGTQLPLENYGARFPAT